MNAYEFNNQLLAFSPNLKAFALHLTQNQTEADDLYQDTAFKALRNRQQYTPQTNLHAWLLTIMRNTFINEWRRKKRRQNQQNEQTIQLMVQPETATHNQGQGKVMLEELTEIVEQVENSLRIPFLMAYRGYSYQEIAETLNLPLGTIKSRIHLARKELKKRIKKLYGVQQLAGFLD